MKKIMSAVMAMMMAVGLLTGCSGDTSSKKDQNTIVIWHDKEDEVVKVLKNNLKTLEPGVKVVLEKKTSLTDSLKMVGNDPKSAPDMYIFAHDKIGVFAETGTLAPITDIIPKKELNGYIDKTIEAATYKGKIYQLPIYYETLLYMYNRDYMKDDEVPRTTEDLYKYMQENTNGGHYGFVEQHSTPYYAAGWINGYGGSILSKDGKPQLDSDTTIAALKYHKKFVDLMPGETEYATVNTLFKEGMAHSTIGGPWLIPTVRKSGMNVGVAPMPVINDSGKPISPYMGVQGVHVLKNAEKNKKSAVKKVLKVLMKPEVQIELAKATGCAPATEACYDMDEIKNDDVVMMMKKTAENAVPMPNVPEMDVMWTVTGNLLTDVNMSNKDINESAKKAQKEAEKLIKSMQ